MEQTIKSRIVSGGINNLQSTCINDQTLRIARGSDKEIKLIYIKSIVRVDLTLIIAPMIVDTNIDTYITCDNIVYKLALDLININSVGAIEILQSILFNEIYRIGIQASVISGRDHANYINNLNPKLVNIIDKIYKVMS